MADQRPTQTAKESKGFCNRLKKVFGRGSQSTPPSRSNSPPAVIAPPAVVASPPTFAAPPADPLPLADLSPTVSTITTDPKEAAKLRAKYTHFRILVIGRANAGKTTLLKRVCNSTEDPRYSEINPASKRGIHNVHHEFSFKSNPRFIFHDSPGFEAGGEQELQDVLSFIQGKAKATEVRDQVHAIWFCFAPDVARPLLELEQRFFNEQRGGNVPVVAIFTKFDDLITQVYDRNKKDEENREVACATLEKKFEKPLEGYNFPPRAYVRFESIDEDKGNHQEQVGELIKQTAASIDDLALKMLFVTVQKNNLEVCIEYAVNKFIFEHTSTVEELINKAGSWFGHCYIQNYDYGKESGFELLGGLGEPFVQNVQHLVNAQFNGLSLSSFIGILICLENSFWIAQQGSNSIDGFTKAWNFYLKTQHALVDRELDNYLWSKGSNDWFTMQYHPTEEECANCTKIVLNNLLPCPTTST